MPQKPENLILLKRSDVSGVIPVLSSLELGELAINVADGKLFAKTKTNSLTSIKTFLNSDDQYFVFDKSLSGVNTQYGNNVVSEIFGTVLGGINNNVSGGGSTIVNGESNNNAGDFSIIGAGLENKISQDCGYSFIAAGSGNVINHQNVFTLGTNITSNASNFTYVNNLSVLGKIYGDGTEISGIISSGTNIDTGVRGLSANWEDTYTTVQSKSANWESAYSSAGADLLVRSLTANWESTYTTTQTNSANWQTAYAYVSANSVNLTATNVFVTNDLTVTDTVSAKYYQGTLIDWMTLVRGTKTTPTLLATIGTGDVYTYVYSTATTDKTYYRYIATDGSEDSFYGNFTNPTLSNLIATKKIIL
jgi:hypothetical protein